MIDLKNIWPGRDFQKDEVAGGQREVTEAHVSFTQYLERPYQAAGKLSHGYYPDSEENAVWKYKQERFLT